MKYNVHIEAFNEKGECIQTEDVHNTVTQAGKRMIAEVLGRGCIGAMANLGLANYIATGTGQLAAADSDIAMGAPVWSQQIVGFSPPNSTSFVAADAANINAKAIITHVMPLNAGVTANIYEVGLLTTSHGGAYKLFARAVHSLIVKNATVEIKYTWTFTF